RNLASSRCSSSSPEGLQNPVGDGYARMILGCFAYGSFLAEAVLETLYDIGRLVGGTERMFFFSSIRRHTSSTRDWSSDVCSSDLRSRPRAVDTGGSAAPRHLAGYLFPPRRRAHRGTGKAAQRRGGPDRRADEGRAEPGGRSAEDRKSVV